MTSPRKGELWLEDDQATTRLGAAVARGLAAGEAVCLWGPHEDVPSPTFTLVQVYDGEVLTVAHFDLYRLSDPDEIHEIGLDEALETGAAIIEWPERLNGRLPANRLDIEIRPGERDGIEGRLARLTPHGSWEGRTVEV